MSISSRKCSMNILVLLLTVLILPANGQTSPVSSEDSSCFEHDFYDCSVCSCGLDEPIHHTFIFILHLVSFVISFLFILTFISIQGLRRHPGSIVVALMSANLIYSLETLITSFNHMINSSAQMNNDTSCLAFGYINFISLCLTYLYQVSFFGFYTFVKHQQRASRTLNSEYHIVPIALTIFIVVYLYSQNGFGRTIGGGCSVKSSSSVATPIVGFSILIAISIGLLYFMRRIFAGDNSVTRSIIRATSRYSKYLLITCFVYLVICILTTAMAICVGMYEPNGQNSLVGSLDTLEVFLNLFQVINPLLVMVAWLRDPKSHEPLQQYLGEYRWINWLWTVKSSYTMGDLMDEESERLDRHFLNDGSVEGETVHIIDENAAQHVDPNSKEHRLNIIFTILLSVRYYWHIQKQKRLEARDSQREIEADQQNYYRREARNKKCFHINTENMQKELPRVLGAIIPQNQRITQGILTVYAMNLFGEVISLDEAGKYIQLSLDVGKNLSAVTKTGINPKGTNTAFNFMSADNKIIFRSISEKELNTLLRILPYFVRHLKSNQNSLIAKIYGAFTYEVMTPYQKLHFIAIRNINKHPPHSIERTYELKGTARFRRTVMEDNMEKSELRHCGVLKDFDFNNFEKSIRVGSENQSKLLNILKRDIHFLVSQDLVDYSLSLFMVNRGRLPSVLSDVTEAAEQLEESFPGGDKLWRGESIISRDSQSLDTGDGARRNNPYGELESSDEEVHYVIGIIDYLNEYNTKKKINILLRRWGLNHSHDDLTSEEPMTYGRRFTDYLEKIVES